MNNKINNNKKIYGNIAISLYLVLILFNIYRYIEEVAIYFDLSEQLMFLVSIVVNIMIIVSIKQNYVSQSFLKRFWVLYFICIISIIEKTMYQISMLIDFGLGLEYGWESLQYDFCEFLIISIAILVSTTAYFLVKLIKLCLKEGEEATLVRYEKIKFRLNVTCIIVVVMTPAVVFAMDSFDIWDTPYNLIWVVEFGAYFYTIKWFVFCKHKLEGVWYDPKIEF